MSGQQDDRAREAAGRAWAEWLSTNEDRFAPGERTVVGVEFFHAGYDAATRALAEELAETEKRLNELAVNDGIGPISAEVWQRSEDVKGALFEKVRMLEAALAEDGWITCGDFHTDPETNERMRVLRSNEGFPTEPGCGKRMRWTYAYRCAECGRWFDRECILKHFAEHGNDFAESLYRAEKAYSERIRAAEAALGRAGGGAPG